MMAARQVGFHGRARTFLAWAGLVLFLASFVWWQSLPNRPHSDETASDTTSRDGLGVVIIDPGHGGQDSGMIHSGIMEKDLALDVARRVDRILQSKRVPTLLTRTGDNYISLAGRAAAANREPNGLFVSIHFDEAPPAATGVETYFAAHQISSAPMIVSWLPFLQGTPADQANLESQSLAGLIQESLVAGTHAVNRGTRAQQFYVVTNVRHPAVLIEGGFLTNKEDAAKLMTEEYREQLAGAIAAGVMKYRSMIAERQRTLATQLHGT